MRAKVTLIIATVRGGVAAVPLASVAKAKPTPHQRRRAFFRPHLFRRNSVSSRPLAVLFMI